MLVVSTFIVPVFFATFALAAVDGSLVPPYSANRIDYDSPPDGQYDRIFLQVGIATNSGGEFALYVNLGGLGVGGRLLLLEPGTHRVEVPVDVQPLRAAGDGPYTLGLSLADAARAETLASDSFTTPAWRSTDFEGPDVEIAGDIRNWPLDVDVPPNGLYDFLVIEVPLTVREVGTYTLSLADAGRFVVENISYLAPGNRSVRLEITANQIRTASSTFGFGCLDVNVDSRNIVGPRAPCSVFPGDNATASKYEPIGASLEGLATDEGVDTDSPPDGRFDALSVQVPLTVNRSADYGIYASLRAADGTFVGSGFRTAYLSRGEATIEVRFSHVDIARNRVDGTLDVDVTLSDDRTTQLGRARYTTKSYSWTAFDPLPVLSGAAIEDAYVDTSSPPDGILDEYLLQIPITVDIPGPYLVRAFINFARWDTDPYGGAQLAQSSVVNLEIGSAVVELAFPLGDFTAHGVTPEHAFEASYLISPLDGAYRFSSPFRPSPAPPGAALAAADVRIVGTPAAVLPDADRDGLFDELAFDMNVTVTRPGLYAFHALMQAIQGNYPVSFTTSHANLSAGPQQVRLVFPAWAIAASGLDGPYLVSLWYGRRLGDPVPSDALMGQATTFWYSPRIFHWQFGENRTIVQSRVPTVPPVVDGRIEATEWGDAGTVDLGASDPGGLTAKMLVANDDEFLYVALDVIGDRTDDVADSAGLAFDVGEVGVPTPYSDDRIMIGGLYGLPVGEIRCPGGDDLFLTTGLCQKPFDTSAPDRASLAAARGFGSSLSEASGHRIYEFRIPLRMLHIRPGDTIGVAVHSYSGGGIYDASGYTVAWPVNSAGFSWFPINNYARLTLGEGPPATNGDGTLASGLTVGLVAATICIATLATIFFVWKRRRKSRPPG